MTRKSEAIKEVKVRMSPKVRAKEPFMQKAMRQITCALSWPMFRHAYDAIFVERRDKRYSYYEHCAICGRARSWVAPFNNHGKPGSKTIARTESYHVDEHGEEVWD